MYAQIAADLKSRATKETYDAYEAKFADMRGFCRFYFVTHSSHPTLSQVPQESNDGAFVFWGAERLALQAVRSGLAGWLMDKAA